ncbi:MAG: ribosome silencing factor [Lachnospiraceae bacterium]|jgi:ribosome-associated protein|nr:ribosome silencing factor [Lachnospiraceae bacterium]MBQ9342196.1 ribosome silencing factor [Lachnospiraceae bacterium]MBQ9580457.1 ribosome silencing factor [Lachnospiraceae bacterium]
MNNAKEMMEIAVNALDEKKAIDIRVIDISNVSLVADYFVIAAASNPNQMSALTRNVDEMLTKAGYNLKSQEGNSYSTWILLDYTDIIVHVFTEEDREFYNLEKLWQDGVEIPVKDIIKKKEEQ